ncbi:MAG: L-2-amino-thiazoline-4-carboxylic acid hydrolase [Nitrospinota bacterium]
MSEVENVAQESARFFAAFYAVVARKLRERLGEEGLELLKEALREFGRRRGEEIRQRVKEKGLPLTLENFVSHYNLPMAPAWRSERHLREKERSSDIFFCPFADLWLKEGVPELGLLYCQEVDPAIRKGYREDLSFESSENILKGDPHCHHEEVLKGEGNPSRREKT